MPLFDSKNQPKKRRGKNKNSAFFEALRRKFEGGEDEFLDHVINLAVGDKEKGTKPNHQLLQLIVARTHPVSKSQSPKITFDFDEEKSPAEQVDDALRAAAKGEISLDSANGIVSIIQTKMRIKEISEFDARLTELEKINEHDR